MKKEDFIKRGWTFQREFYGQMSFEKGDVWKDDGRGAFLDVKDENIRIVTTDKGTNMEGPNSSVKFNGNCKNMDEFDMVCRMIVLPK